MITNGTGLEQLVHTHRTLYPERLAERVWFPNKFQSSFSFLNIVFRDRAGGGAGGGGGL